MPQPGDALGHVAELLVGPPRLGGGHGPPRLVELVGLVWNHVIEITAKTCAAASCEFLICAAAPGPRRASAASAGQAMPRTPAFAPGNRSSRRPLVPAPHRARAHGCRGRAG